MLLVEILNIELDKPISPFHISLIVMLLWVSRVGTSNTFSLIFDIRKWIMYISVATKSSITQPWLAQQVYIYLPVARDFT